jgi:serine/threonine protein phosphatase PrpC
MTPWGKTSLGEGTPAAAEPEPAPRVAVPLRPAVLVTAVTSRGLVRTGNEDRIGALGWLAPLEQPAPVTLSALDTGHLVVAVADGLGGHAAGEVASQMAVSRLMDAAPGLDTAEAVRSALARIHSELLEQGARRPDWAGMATTIAAVIVTPRSVLCAHVGDSRIYYVEAGLLDQLTEDDAVRGVLEQCLGGQPGRPFDPHVREMRRDMPARYLLCSDGLHGCVPRDLIRDLAAVDSPLAAAAGLHSAAMRAGAPDNVSLCLVDVIPASAAAPPTPGQPSAPPAGGRSGEGAGR